MTIKEKLTQIVVALALTTKAAKKGGLTNEDWKNIQKSYKETFGVDLEADVQASAKPENQEAISPELRSKVEGILNDEDPQLTDTAGDQGTGGTTEASRQFDITGALTGLTNKIEAQNAVISKLAEKPELGNATETANINQNAMTARVLGKTAHTAGHIFGIEAPFFAKGKWWNDITASKKQIELQDVDNASKQSFMEEFTSYIDGFKKRTAYLSENNMLGSMNFNKMISGESHIDYSDLLGKAGEYVVRRQDLILAYLRSLPSVESIFPLVSNIQNKEIAPGANFGELSQGYRSGKVFKGNVAFTAEIYSVTDVMFKFQFSDMIKLEKQYIGFLNREGSSVIKWTFIEWVIIHFGKILFNEQQRRRVVGVRVPQQNVVSNPAVFGADGALRAIERVEEELKVLPFVDLKVYTDVTILEYLENFYGKVEEILPNMEGVMMYCNAKHRRWYQALYRAKYGKDGDFTVNKDQLIDTLSPSNIIWVPNMDNNCYKVWMTVPGNVENYEDKPQEMTLFYFERDFENILVMSRWKEGSGLQMAGVKYATPALLEASQRADQWIFTNYPVTVLDADATTIDGKVNSLFLTSVNTVATVITDITNASIEKVYKVICGGTANATTITKADNFSKIAADWVPTAVGDYIKLYAELENYEVIVDGETVIKTRATGKFLELERKVTA